MEMRTGYKQTEVGVIPNDWNLDSLASVTPSNGRNGIVDGPFGSNLKTIHYRKSGVPIVTSGFVTDGHFFADSYIYVDREKFEQEKRSAVQAGDIVMAKIGARCGASAILPEWHQVSILSGNALKITVDQSRHSTFYIWQVLWNLYLRGRMEALRTVGAQPAISMAQLKQYRIPLPPLAEQRAIATALSDLDALLAAQNKVIDKKRNIMQATMQQILTGKHRLPGFNANWNLTELKQLVSTPITDGPHLTPRFYDSGVPFLSVNNLVNNRIDITDLRFISKEDDLIFAKKCKPQRGDVLIGKAASVGKVAIVEDDFDFNIWSPIALVRPNRKIYNKFLYYQLLSENCVAQINLLTNSSSQGNIGMSDIEKIQISHPDIEEQTAIATVLSEMDADITSLEQQRDKILAIKQGMMQELLTGRIRLI